ncbi:hypothetical protein HBH64_019630 [Parastagonospora nodorum]|nr:hypothetical protein HBI01_199930 [Parastagonospora nodorum]KAH4313296.1 hypothetical protein HBI02_082220 [Parastagonospora nodorum]KAH4335725.1 hypothetical protein HBI00_022520 [Parastagonospora nodorum]KAH4384183.1 hypothetical protein HBH94_049400 [Parastagonospora nodorum]KAH4473162.1 hypothetical protein HBH90_039180 [Parastagonospora nodorum]
MRLFYTLSLVSVVVLASDLTTARCRCPQVKCPTDDWSALCNCLNDREAKCEDRCPDYKPKYRFCPYPYQPPMLLPDPVPSPEPTTEPAKCECPLVNCLQGPGLCDCIKTAAQNCYQRCGGTPPKLQSCPDLPQSTPEATCECESVFCAQSFPESCYCANAAAQACYKKCGVVPNLQQCPPNEIPSMTTTTLQTSTLPAEPAPTLLPPNTHKLCGGGRANAFQCDEGFTCITDPYTPGCGPACDGLGICVEDKICGGFAGFECADQNQVCLDDERDDCDPAQGGSDCAGLCVTPHRSLGSDL